MTSPEEDREPSTTLQGRLFVAPAGADPGDPTSWTEVGVAEVTVTGDLWFSPDLEEPEPPQPQTTDGVLADIDRAIAGYAGHTARDNSVSGDAMRWIPDDDPPGGEEPPVGFARGGVIASAVMSGLTGLPAALRRVDRRSVIHGCPPDDGHYTPCCGRTLFELPSYDRLTLDDTAVTCEGSPNRA